MSTVNFSMQSELSLAAYANLFGGISSQAYKDALTAADMSDSEASQFSSSWLVLDQYTDSASGLSATIFQQRDAVGNPTGAKYLAIRGTEPEANDLTADGLLALGLPASLNPQFTALKNHLDTVWLANGGFLHGETFTVSGHSLGGYLVAAVKQQYGTQVSDAYLYNAPGVAGLVGGILDLFGLNTPSANVWNITASEGASVISGLGAPVGTLVPVQIEAAPGLGLGNHSIVRLTDALAIQSLYTTLDPSLTNTQLNTLVDASGNPMNQTLESALDAIRKLLLGDNVTATPADNRDSFYNNLYALQDTTAYSALAGHAQITVLADTVYPELIGLARQTDAQGLAVRYALQALNPFALTGIDYASRNSDGSLDLYDADHPSGMTESYLADRANFLQRKTWFSTEDKKPNNPAMTLENATHPYEAESVLYEDIATHTKINQGGVFPNTPRYLFGDGNANSLTGGSVADHLYGGAGVDTLIGLHGNDYLEGGTGDDLYKFSSGDGQDQIVDGDGGTLLRNGKALGAGYRSGADEWKGNDGTLYTKQGNDLLIRFGNSTNADQITLKNFDFISAQAEGAETNAADFGIALKAAKLALLPTLNRTSNPAQGDGEVAPTSTTLKEGGLRLMTLYASGTSDSDRTVTLSLADAGGGGLDRSHYQISTGADLLAFQNGSVTLTLAAGQDKLSFALLTQGDLDQNASLTLDAVLGDGTGGDLAGTALDVADGFEGQPMNDYEWRMAA